MKFPQKYIVITAGGLLLAGILLLATLLRVWEEPTASDLGEIPGLTTGLEQGTSCEYPERSCRMLKGRQVESETSAFMRIHIPNPTLKHFLQTLLQPLGATMYVWGGGWNEEDTGAGISAVTIGVSPAWAAFAEKQTADYDWHQTKYQIEDGLDCSGYVGWGLYNTLNTVSGGSGYVRKAKEIAGNLADRGFGQYIAKEAVCDYRPGDVMSSACTDCGHVWVVVGQCTDGSVVLLHATPPGVMLEGTVAADGTKESEAVRLARTYMERYYAQWQITYPAACKDIRFLTHYGQFRWDLTGESVMADPDGYAQKSAEEVLKDLFET